MSYSVDLRERVVRFVSGGGSQTEASSVFGVSRKTIYHWLHRPTLQPTLKPFRNGKINKTELLAHVTAHPDALLRERAAAFGVTPSGMWRSLRKLGCSLELTK